MMKCLVYYTLSWITYFQQFVVLLQKRFCKITLALSRNHVISVNVCYVLRKAVIACYFR